LIDTVVFLKNSIKYTQLTNTGPSIPNTCGICILHYQYNTHTHSVTNTCTYSIKEAMMLQSNTYRIYKSLSKNNNSV